MRHQFTKQALAMGTVVLTLSAMGGTSSATTVTRAKGDAQYVDISWVEYDPDDLLGLPGNVHVGYLSANYSQWGTYFYGNVTDFDCDDGETPWGGGGHGAVEDALEEVVDEAADTTGDAAMDAVEDVIDSNESVIDADAVISQIQTELSEDVPEVIDEEFQEFPACDYLQDRFLDGSGTATMTVDKSRQIARITGTLTVSHGGHGEPSQVLGNPPVDITITGGQWERYESFYKTNGSSYNYTYSDNGTRFYGGTVEGGIGQMGFADDADDVSFGGFSFSRFQTVERVR